MKKLSEKNIAFIVTLIFLCLLMFLPIISVAYSESKRNVATSFSNNKPVSVKNTTVRQEILLEGRLRNLSFLFSAPSGSLYENATVKISVEQNGNCKEKILTAQKIKSGLWKLPIKKGWLKQGTATVTFAGENFPDGTDLFLLKSDDFASGLKNAFVDENDLGGPLTLNYNVFIFNGNFWYTSGLSLLLFLTLVVASYLFVFKRDWGVEKNAFFWCSFLVVFLFESITNPVASFYAEPYSEMVYEFWAKAHNMGFFKSLMSLMSEEALVWTERIMMSIADFISPTKYVFVTAQIMQLLLISSFASIICLKPYNRFFPIELRFILSIAIGCFILFSQAYWFWGVSYWAVVFLIPLYFIDMEKIRKPIYIATIVLTVILCMSRIYHIVFVPIALLILLFFKTSKGPRFFVYNLTIAIASLFEVIFSLASSQQGHINDVKNNLDILRAIKNTIYYQVQAINSFFFGNFSGNGVVINILGLFFIFFVAILILYIFFHKKEKETAVALLCAGILSFGTIAINVVTNMTSKAVAFAHAYASPISWRETYYQNADFHFSYAYFALLLIVVILLYYALTYFKPVFFNERIKAINFRNIVLCTASLLCLTILEKNYNKANAANLRYNPTDWKNICYVLNRDSYYMSVNVAYPFAPISFFKNAHSLIIAFSSDKSCYEWDWSKPEYLHDIHIHNANLSDIPDFPNKTIISMTIYKSLKNFAVPYYAVFKKANGNIIARIKQKTSYERYNADFYPDTPLTDVASVSFELEDGSPAYIYDALQFGISDLPRKKQFVLPSLPIKEISLNIGRDNGVYIGALNASLINNDHIALSNAIHDAENNFVITGWAIDFANSTPVDSLYIRAGDKVSKAHYGIFRADVKEYISPAYEASGFQFNLDKDFFQNTVGAVVSEVELFMVSHDENGAFIYEPVVYKIQ